MINLIILFSCLSFHYVSGTADTTTLFHEEKQPLNKEVVVTSPQDIVTIMEETADFLKKIKKHPSKFVTVTPGLFDSLGVTVDDVLQTVEFIAEVGKEQPELLHDTTFLNDNFTFYRWHGDASKKVGSIPKGWARPPESIITTQYRITEIPASHTKDENCVYPIYSLPPDEVNLTRDQKLAKKNDLIRFKYTRTEIVDSSSHCFHHAKPLAWVTDEGRKEFAMQGSVLLLFKNGHKQLIRVAGNNDMKGEDEYWFAEVVKKRKESRFPVKIKPRRDVTYAADIDLLGFGKVILLKCWNPQKKRKEVRLGVLVDTGSAFKNNLAKLDMFTGYFPDEQSFQKHIKSYPHTARAYILIKKKTVKYKKLV
jgi:hypothetical protein